MLKAFVYGIASSLFFALTFILNRQMQLNGGHWIWTASLRFVFMFPILFLMVLQKKRYKSVFFEIKNNMLNWFLWSNVGFSFFYLFLCIASSSSPSWMIASMWQLTILAGILLTPLFRNNNQRDGIRHTIPKKQLFVSFLIISGVFLVQYKKGITIEIWNTYLPMVYIIIAAFSYPLGNRKMMAIAPSSMNTIDRIFGMTLCSLPFWAILMVIGLFNNILPTSDQIKQTLIVALSAGIIATVLFFKATEIVKYDVKKLAIIESTQAGEVVFTLILGMFIFNDQSPSKIAILGIVIIISGMIINNINQRKKT